MVNPGPRHVNTPASQFYREYGGWKLHLTVRPENYAIVDSWLDRNHEGQYKLLHGGDPGEKDFTIYVGYKDDAIRLARKITSEIGNYLEISNAGSEDIYITPKVAARFDPRGDKFRYMGKTGSMVNSRQLFYGKRGIPYDSRAAEIREQINLEKRFGTSPERKKYWEEALQNREQDIKKELGDQFGIMFTGTGENTLLRRKKVVKRKVKRKAVKKVKKCRCR